MLTNPIMVWLYTVAIGILASLGAIAGTLINTAAFGLFAMILTVPLMVALSSLTAPFGLLGLIVAYEELSGKEPGQLKLDKQVLQIGGIVLACLVVVGLVARFAFHRGYYNAWGVGRLFGARAGVSGFGRPSRVNLGGLDIGEGLPKGFPKDVPIYPGAKVTGGLGASDKEGSGSMTTLTTKDPPPSRPVDKSKAPVTGPRT